MAPRPMIFAMANPTPEISYEEARAARPDAILATGRSDYPNQINNVLGFPFIFRGALDVRAKQISREMLRAATHALAELARADVPDKVLSAYGLDQLAFGTDYIIPKPFDPRVLTHVAPAVAKAAAESGMARQPIADLEAYRERLLLTVQRARGIMHPLIRQARANKARARIVFSDSSTPKILKAAQLLRDDGICTPVLLGAERAIRQLAEEVHVSLDGCEIVEINNNPQREYLTNLLWQMRARKGMTLGGAKAKLRQRTWFGAMMVKAGMVDGMVGGLRRPYKETIGPAITVLGLRQGRQIVSGVYAMLFKDRRIFFGDCTVNVDPTAEQLAEIAMNTARVAEVFGDTPRVAMLSYSDFGEHYKDPKVATVRRAMEIVRERWPSLEIDGEMQADTALDRRKLTENFPFSSLSATANVLVFPDLTSANIAYKLLVKLTDAEALGPLVIGLGGAISVIPVGATETEIANIATWTVVRSMQTTPSADSVRVPAPFTRR
jgi:malate dehydrogenase (oxaloacetate-decarboxylating)(NADP+)